MPLELSRSSAHIISSGLIYPVAAIIWTYALSRVYYVWKLPTLEYTFIFIASWFLGLALNRGILKPIHQAAKFSQQDQDDSWGCIILMMIILWIAAALIFYFCVSSLMFGMAFIAVSLALFGILHDAPQAFRRSMSIGFSLMFIVSFPAYYYSVWNYIFSAVPFILGLYMGIIVYTRDLCMRLCSHEHRSIDVHDHFHYWAQQEIETNIKLAKAGIAFWSIVLIVWAFWDGIEFAWSFTLSLLLANWKALFSTQSGDSLILTELSIAIILCLPAMAIIANSWF